MAGSRNDALGQSFTETSVRQGDHCSRTVLTRTVPSSNLRKVESEAGEPNTPA